MKSVNKSHSGSSEPEPAFLCIRIRYPPFSSYSSSPIPILQVIQAFYIGELSQYAITDNPVTTVSDIHVKSVQRCHPPASMN